MTVTLTFEEVIGAVQDKLREKGFKTETDQVNLIAVDGNGDEVDCDEVIAECEVEEVTRKK